MAAIPVQADVILQLIVLRPVSANMQSEDWQLQEFCGDFLDNPFAQFCSSCVDNLFALPNGRMKAAH